MSPKFSLVIPILNEEESIPELVSQIADVMRSLDESYEILFVDDGSTDKTLPILKELSAKNKHIRVDSFRRNLGKSPALTYGFQHAKGEFVLTLDADLQDDPANIPLLYQTLIEGDYDMVTGWRKNRRDPIRKVISSKFFNGLVSFMFSFKINDLNCGLKIYRAELAKELNLYGGRHRFIPVLANEMGSAVGEVPIVHHQRKYGVSKYKFTKILTDIPDLMTMYFLTKYTGRPLHFFWKVGVTMLTLGLIVLIYLSYLHFMGERIGNRPLLLFGVLIVIAGIQTVFTGLIGDLLVSLLSNQKENMPTKYESK
jgi:glycosyltransferase involved in cell wall biosynthesis